MVPEVVHEDMGEDTMQCTNHPSKNSTPGGICAFCLQEKLGKLVSSSFPVLVFPASSSSSSPSFRSDIIANGVGVTDKQKTHSHIGGSSASSSSSSSSVINPRSGGNDCNKYHGYCSTRRPRLPFILTHSRRKKKKDGIIVGSTASDSASILFKRSKSTTSPRRGMHYLNKKYGEDYSPHRRGFWSFLYLSKHYYSTVKRSDKSSKVLHFTPTTPRTVIGTTSTSSAVASSSAGDVESNNKKREDLAVVDEDGSPDRASFDRKVPRSRSVGCGSRSFSGDFFERISTGFGDCTLRRVESQREGKHRVQSSGANNGHRRVRCGGIFSGFMISSSSSDGNTVNGNKSMSASSHATARSHLSHGRSRSWGWALASTMRAFSKPYSSGRRDSASTKNVAPNLAAIPSLLA